MFSSYYKYGQSEVTDFIYGKIYRRHILNEK